MNTVDINHRIAAAINNTGVTLMQHGALREAMDAFRHAVTVMNKGVLVMTSADPNAMVMSPLDSQALLEQVTMTQLSLCSHKKFKADDNDTNAPRIQPLVFSETNLAAMVAVMRNGPNASCLFPVRLESIVTSPENADEFEYTQSPHIDAGIILYNYGLAHYSRYQMEISSPSKSNNNNTKQALHCAIRMLKLSQQILLQSCMLCEENEASCTIPVMTVSGLVVNVVATIFLQQQEGVLANEALHTVAQLLEAIEDGQDYADGSCHVVVAAAA